MTTICLALGRGVLVVSDAGGAWGAEPRLEGRSVNCAAVDPLHPERLWCGTAGAGVWRSDDAGGTWRQAGDGLRTAHVSALGVAPGEAAVYVGTDPSAMWRSEDAGRDWEALAGLTALPSASSWSFPPRPETSHVRWITLDPAAPDLLYVCIEAGALVRSRDGGRTWTDRVPGGPWDTHTLAVHADAPGRLYSAAGDGFGSPGRGFNESRDGGDTWSQPDEGIEHHYLYGLAVDAGDPDTIVVSAADSPRQAHSLGAARSHVYRRTAAGPWTEVGDGLPAPAGTLRTLFAADPGRSGVFYGANNRGLFRSTDGGCSWDPIPAAAQSGLLGAGVHGIAVAA